jgi:hypothetical protein
VSVLKYLWAGCETHDFVKVVLELVTSETNVQFEELAVLISQELVEVGLIEWTFGIDWDTRHARRF